MQIEEFLEFLFGEEEGFVYAPFKLNERFEKHWYIWPDEKESLAKNLLGNAKFGDCYLSPVLYTDTDTKAFQSSNVVWCDFDDGIPSELGDFPKPSVQIASSDGIRKQHWYWRLERTCRDSRYLERCNKQLAYALGADKGCWNFSRVLRPFGTLNYKYDPPAPVSLVSFTDSSIDDYVFSALPDVPMTTVDDISFTRLDKASLYSQQGTWPVKAWEFFLANKTDGERHTALTSIAITCVELGFDDNVTMNFLIDADDRWKKYVGRSDRYERLWSIVAYARTMVGETEESRVRSPSDDSQIAGGNSRPQPFNKFVRHEFQVDWVIEDLLHSKGLGIVAAPPGIGKTQFSLNLAISVSIGNSFLNWEIEKPRRVLFLSLEMMQPELKFYLDKMTEELTEEDKQLLNDNCFFVARQAFRLNSDANQAKLLQWIDEIKPEGIFIDSLSRASGGDLEKGEIDKVFDFINSEIRDKRGCFVWFVHHNRKANFNQKQPKKLEDMYGSQYIGAYASTVIGLWKVAAELEVNCLKIWLAPPFKSFLIQRTDNLTFVAPKAVEY